MTAPAQTLSSHISIINKRNADNASNSPFGKSSGGGSNAKPATGRSQPSANRRSPEQKTSAPKKVANLEPFELFCAYHLGIGPDKQYKPSNINEVANRFRQEPGLIRQALKEYGMDSASLLDRDFDMALAQLDIQVAPEGVDRIELAKNIYEEYLEAPYQKRDWKKILDEDRNENRKIFGGY